MPKNPWELSRRQFMQTSIFGAAAVSPLGRLAAAAAENLVSPERVGMPKRVLGFYVPFHEIPNERSMKKFKDLLLAAGANTVVIDIKNEAGLIGIGEFTHPLESKWHSSVEDYAKFDDFMSWCDRNKIFIIGRQVVMEDARLVYAHPELGIHTKSGKVWTGGGRIWANPFDERVVEYNAAVAEAAAAKGIKMIQYDYVRFPADGDLSTIWHSKANTRDNRVAAITAFFAAAKPRVNQYGALLTADFFGYTAYASYKDMGVGQLLESAGPVLDGVCPMAYPGLYGGGVVEEACGKNNCTPPTLYPYEIVYYTVARTLERLLAVNPNAFVLPWIQAYPDGRYFKPMKLPQFEAQQRGALDAGGVGALAWNPSMLYHPEFFHVINREL